MIREIKLNHKKRNLLWLRDGDNPGVDGSNVVLGSQQDL